MRFLLQPSAPLLYDQLSRGPAGTFQVQVSVGEMIGVFTGVNRAVCRKTVDELVM